MKPEVRTWVQDVYLGDSPREQEWESRQTEAGKKEKLKGKLDSFWGPWEHSPSRPPESAPKASARKIGGHWGVSPPSLNPTGWRVTLQTLAFTHVWIEFFQQTREPPSSWNVWEGPGVEVGKCQEWPLWDGSCGPCGSLVTQMWLWSEVVERRGPWVERCLPQSLWSREARVILYVDFSLAAGEDCRTSPGRWGRSCLVFNPQPPSPSKAMSLPSPALKISSRLWSSRDLVTASAATVIRGWAWTDYISWASIGGSGFLKSLPKQPGAFPFVTSVSAHTVTCPEFGRRGPGWPMWTSNLELSSIYKGITSKEEHLWSWQRPN